jgi:sugar phosphate permease
MTRAWRGIRRFFQIYLAYFLLITAIVAAGFGVESGSAGTVVLSFLVAIVLVLLSARVAGVRWPRRKE